MSAARTLGGWLPVDMMRRSRQTPRAACRRNGVSPSTSRSAGDSFSGVQSSCRNSGTTFSPITRLARITEFTRIARRRIEGLDRADAVGRDHRHARQRQFERHGAGLGERRMRDPERRALLLPRRPRRGAAPASPSRASRDRLLQDAAWSAAPARTRRPRPAAGRASGRTPPCGA